MLDYPVIFFVAEIHTEQVISYSSSKAALISSAPPSRPNVLWVNLSPSLTEEILTEGKTDANFGQCDLFVYEKVLTWRYRRGRTGRNTQFL